MSKTDPTPAALKDLASDYRLIPNLIARAVAALDERKEDPGLDAFLPAFAAARETLASDRRYFDARTGNPVPFDRD